MFKIDGMLMVRLSLAAVWAHQGVWCKWMGRDRRHAAVADAAGFGWAVAVIGAAEALIAIWVITGWARVAAAAVQTAAIVAMNAGGLWRARCLIADPAGMVLQNAAFLMLAWVAAGVIHGR
jgi:hypothetical protein